MASGKKLVLGHACKLQAFTSETDVSVHYTPGACNTVGNHMKGGEADAIVLGKADFPA